MATSKYTKILGIPIQNVVVEQTNFVTDRQTDKMKTTCLPQKDKNNIPHIMS